MTSPAFLIAVTALLNFMMLLVLMSLRRSGLPGVREWLWANVLELAALGCYLASPLGFAFIPIVLGNALLGAAICMFYAGCRRFAQLSVPVRPLLISLVVYTIILGALRFYVDYFNLRVVVTSIYHGTLDVMIGYTILRHHPKTRSTHGHDFTGGFALVLALAYLARCVLYLLHPELKYWFTDYSALNLTFLALGAVVIPGLTMGAVVMAHDAILTASEEVASRDFLTNALSRKAFIEQATRQMATAARSGRPVSLLLLDIDHFKSINDRFGHAVGDEVLRDFTLIMHSALRAADCLGRLGGEEFGLLLYGASPAEARSISERLRALVEANTMRIGDNLASYTMSGGLAHWSVEESLQELTLRADTALYQAKDAGRNRIVVSQPTAPTTPPEHER
ncbi:GGDEF domain-containing protein [Silvimonas iriomotensis]|uniref:diguanylate cyclase n=1 Tax=Silvimonas iriomotensis TaxID=449662 RepID=A0ABQ2PFV1_9NEIS|nr:GGDEF domain-containing protein [Silvimonas iriomotensis]GGP24074.1 GGDEF domain-containing protein [Silvimonas iriomotensis]